MLEEVLMSQGLDEAIEEMGNRTEEWANKWWWKPLKALIMGGPFIAIAIYYFWFL